MWVDCRVTAHFVIDKLNFMSFDNNFKPENSFIELADGNRRNNIALKKIITCISLVHSNGNLQLYPERYILYITI